MPDLIERLSISGNDERRAELIAATRSNLSPEQIQAVSSLVYDSDVGPFAIGAIAAQKNDSSIEILSQIFRAHFFRREEIPIGEGSLIREIAAFKDGRFRPLLAEYLAHMNPRTELFIAELIEAYLASGGTPTDGVISRIIQSGQLEAWELNKIDRILKGRQ